MMKFDLYIFVQHEDVEFRWVKFGKIQNAEIQCQTPALPGTEMAMLSSELILS